MNNNTKVFQNLEQQSGFDVVVIGGGINGISVFRELALQGVKVLLVEKDDFCSKASAAPSRMIHGGLRYLENGEFSLVKEALFERNRLLSNAPHLVSPLETTIPIFSTWSGVFDGLFKFIGLKDRPSQRGSVVIKLGLSLYDWFTKRDQMMPAHKMHSATVTQKRWPLMGKKVRSSATYFDAWISSPERLAMELIQEGIKAGGTALNYTKVTELSDGQLTLQQPSSESDSESSVQVFSRHVVNATGAWVDSTNGLLTAPSQYMQGTKGSHIIVDNPELLHELNDNMLFYENSEGRVCILFPYFGKVLIGSTDIPVSDPESVHCTDEEIDYILESLTGVLPDLTISRDQIVYQFSGVRPLPSVNASTTGQIPRSHSIKRDVIDGTEVYSLIGGKWTTFRAFGEEVSDELLNILDKPRRCSTKQKQIGGGEGYPVTKKDKDQYVATLTDRYSNQSHSLIDVWFKRYGTGCESLLEWLEGQSDSRLNSLSDYSLGELTYILEHEHVVTSLDVFLRRTSIAIEGKLNNEVFEEISDITADFFNWNSQQREEDREQTKRVLLTFHGVELDGLTKTPETTSKLNNVENQQLLNGEEYVFDQ
ncbi:glycerol-3-phosphate dehydrogenase/oxidase [Vibrio sp. ZSDE26]|uniref:Glycerol-3-phosphate dehydrogenase/oxidase n=1 Tax=Vibrio amylolyticus TaxID=2847292 RepID=A0A9X2BID8_9VIBR|nr:glycerol-3-phosphate dehydrogenase/oxidase [Vibrio amylolyticus]MCK6264906.1 glycerol-3-phosphate dehydrogenase/oxidase [Vibrio amylolyticus]